MQWYRNLKIFHKLILAFAFCGALIAMVGGFAWSRLDRLNTEVQEMNTNWMPAIQSLLRMKVDFMEFRTRELAMFNAKNDEALADFVKGAAANRESFNKSRAFYETTIASDEERKLFNAVDVAANAYWREHEKYFQAIQAREIDLADNLLNGSTRKHRREFGAAIEKLIDYNKKASDENLQETEAVYKSAVTWIALGTIFAIGLGLFMGWAISRMISKPLAEAVSVANAVAEGDLSRKIEVTSQDEVGKLLTAMRGMVETLNDFSAAQKSLAAKHEAGETQARMDVTRFKGAYGELAGGLNELAKGHIDVMEQTLALISEYSQGDLAHDMPALPGDRARITTGIAAVKTNLLAINAEILKLTDAAQRGDFSARGDQNRFQYQFRNMVEGLNGLMDVADRGLNDVARALTSLAAGDLSHRVEGQYAGTFGELKDNSNGTAEQLGIIVQQIREASEAINTAAREIAAGNSDLSSRTEEQASSLEETAASMEELTGTVKQNAENAKQANQLAVSASDVAMQGGQVVSQVVETMGSITESAKKIEDIISVIDGIAFQTNILALNAAVEAARAGEQGRGFAVVASEVRSLAQRSAAAAKEIKGLIGDSVEKVETGSKLVNSAGETMDEVVKSVKRVADIISEITAASQEQSTGIEQVNQAIAQMDQVTQQNAALVEQAAAAAESMEEQAKGLIQSVSVFKLAGGTEARATPKLAAVSPIKPKATATPKLKPVSAPPAKLAAGGDWKDI